MSACCHTSAREETDAALRSEARTWLKLGAAGLLAAQAMIFSLAVNLSPVQGAPRWAIHGALALSAAGVFLLAGWPVWRESWQAARRGRIVFEQLFLAGMAGAFAASVHSSLTGEGHVYYEIVAVLVAIYTFGTLLARRRRDALRESIRGLGAAFDSCERATCCGGLETVGVESIVPGDVVLVGPGRGIPVDGVVGEGVAFVSEAALTGEPYPVVKRAGDPVMAGSRAEDGTLRIIAGSRGRSRRLDALLASVESARLAPGRIQREADRLVAWFLPAVMLIAAATTAGWTMHSGWVTGVFNGLAVLLVACPCSMGLATPVAIWSALAALARRGIFARDGDTIESLARADTVVFDKTGTLSEDEARVEDFVSLPGTDRAQLRREIAAVEAGSHHPVARAFRRGAGDAHELLARDIHVLPGAGVAGRLPDGALLEIGNAAILGAADDPAPLRESLAIRDGGHEVFVRRDGRLCAVALLRESLRESAREAMAEVRAMGLRTIVMTGDRAENAARFGFDECLAGLAPGDKLAEVGRLQAAGHRVLFVGDGINDAPAMAAAEASIAMSTGSELPRETASAEFAGIDLRAIPHAVRVCRATLGVIRRNLAFAAAYNVLGIALAAAGFLHPIAAALIMLLSSVTVTWRVLRETSQTALERNAADARPAPKMTAAAKGLSPAVERTAFASALALQGPALAWLGGFGGGGAAGFIALFAAAGAAVFFFPRRRAWSSAARMTMGMFSVGGLAMLAGWWADAGFAAVVRGGTCLCGCADSNMGLGLLAKLSWMDAGMLAAALPALVLERADGPLLTGRLPSWLAGVAGMIAGMELAGLPLAFLPVTDASAQFFLTYAAMICGMCLGMLGGCAVASRVLGQPRTV